MYALIIIFVLGLVLVYVIWKFTKPKSSSYGIEVVTKDADTKTFSSTLEDDDGLEMSGSVDDEKNIKHKNEEDVKLKGSTEKECIELIYNNPKDINAYLRLSVFYLQRQKWVDAKEVLLEALKVEPENDKVCNNLGIVWYRLKRYNNAVTAFEKALKQNDKVAHRFMNMGLVLSALGENGRASECFSKAVELDPEQKIYQELLSETKSLLV